MDRQIVYPGAIPQDTDILLTNKNALIGLGMLIQAILGTSTVVDGLACNPTGPASLDVVLGPGSIYEQENVDGTAYGSINADTSHQIMKQGIQIGNETLSCPAPVTTGFSINYLIEVAYQDNDTGSTVLPYYNATDPAVAYNGPNNTGVSQNTIRQGELVVTVKPGTAATTGTQTTPAPDAGFTGLWVVTVAFGQTAINSGNIAKYSGAPFINYKLPQLAPPTAARTALTGNTTYHVSPSGNDSTGNGSSGTPWQTLQHAINYVADSVDLAGYNAIIDGGGNTFTVGGTVSQPWVGGGSNNVIIQNFVINATAGNCLAATSPGTGFAINNVTMTNSGSAGVCLGVTDFALVTIGASVSFGNTPTGSQLFIANNACVVVNNAYSYSGNFTNHIQMLTNASLVYAPSLTLAGSGSMTFTTFCSMTGNSSIFFNTGCSFAGGTPSGTNYIIALCSTVNTSGVGTGMFPGSGGTTPDGGQIV